MKTYKIKFSVTQIVDIEVDASTEENAMELAIDDFVYDTGSCVISNRNYDFIEVSNLSEDFYDNRDKDNNESPYGQEDL